MKKPLLLSSILFLFFSFTISAQEVKTDGRLQPLVVEFFEICDSYNIAYKDKLLKLQSIDLVDIIEVLEGVYTLGMLRRDENNKVVAIDINLIAQIDEDILKIVAFHEFGHYFLEYDQHVCDDCGIIMSVMNTSYFEIANDWENQIRILFEQSPAYLKQQNSIATKVAQSYPRN